MEACNLDHREFIGIRADGAGYGMGDVADHRDFSSCGINGGIEEPVETGQETTLAPVGPPRPAVSGQRLLDDFDPCADLAVTDTRDGPAPAHLYARGNDALSRLAYGERGNAWHAQRAGQGGTSCQNERKGNDKHSSHGNYSTPDRRSNPSGCRCPVHLNSPWHHPMLWTDSIENHK